MIKILIVDDMESIRKKFLRILGKRPDMKPYAAQNGYDAMLTVANDAPDIILMDIEMETPLAGLLACQSIYRSNPEIKMIILTVHEDDTIIYKAFQAGIVDYLLKSSSEDEIVKAILDAYNDRTSLQPKIANKLRQEFKRIKDNEDSMVYILNVITQLTPTEIDILKLLNAGMGQKEIAQMRCIELSTMKTHINHILKKFDMKRTSHVLEVIQKVGLFSLLR